MVFFRRHRVPLVLVGLGIVVAVLVGYRIKKQQAAAVPRRQVELVVGVARPVRKGLDVKLAYTADVLPNRQVAIFSKVSGYIRRLGAERGDLVRAGQLLVEIEAQELPAAVEQARAAVAITTGVGEGTLVEITRGLTGDETVIVDGKELVREGLKVRAEARAGAD